MSEKLEQMMAAWVNRNMGLVKVRGGYIPEGMMGGNPLVTDAEGGSLINIGYLVQSTENAAWWDFTDAARAHVKSGQYSKI